MGSQLFDSPPDPLLAFAPETPAAQTPVAETLLERTPVAQTPAAPATDREPAFLRVPVTYDVPSITSIVEQPPVHHVRLGVVGTVAIVAGLLAAFVAGYGFAYRVIASAPAAAPTLVISPPRNPPPPPRTAPPTELPREASAPAAAQRTSSSALPVPAPPAATTRTRVPSRAAARTTAVPVPTSQAGVIEVLSNRGAQVFLDGDAVGRAPLSIADVSEGTHEVRVELPGFKPWGGSIHVKGGSRARIAASLER
jgi:PEGA domain-containing protein